MVKSIELILGLPPMTQLDLAAPPMRTCFQAQPDLTPYACIPAKTPIDEVTPPKKDLKGAALKWAEKSMAMNFEKEDEADDDELNRVIWFAMRGDAPYPEAFALNTTEKGRDDDDDDDKK
jgi:hypothetical protein